MATWSRKRLKAYQLQVEEDDDDDDDSVYCRFLVASDPMPLQPHASKEGQRQARGVRTWGFAPDHRRPVPSTVSPWTL